MRPLDLEEFAENLRVRGDWHEADFAVEILALLDLEKEVAEPYRTLCEDLRWDVPEDLKDKPEKALDYLRDRSKLLADIETLLEEAGRDGAADDEVRELIETIAEAEAILETAGWPGDGDFCDGIQALADRPTPLEYDL